MKKLVIFILSCCMPGLLSLQSAYAMVDDAPPIAEQKEVELLGEEEWMQRGLELNGQGQFDQAAEAFLKALAINNSNAVAWFSLGTAKAFSGKYEEAAGFLSQAVAFDPEMMVAYSNLGAVYGRLERFEEALDAYSRALRLKPDDANARYNRGIVSAGLGDRDSAMMDYELLLATDKELAMELLQFIGP